MAANRSEFYRALASGPFYGFNWPGAKSSEAIIDNWWRQGMMGGAKAHYELSLPPKLSTLTWWADTTLGADLGAATVSTGHIYAAMDWLEDRRCRC